MSRILALDSSTEACSVALLVENVSIHRFADAPRAHTQLLLPMVDEVLTEAKISLADLDAIAFGRGPGSFTGIRIAASMAQGLAFATDKPLLAISTLAALAQGAYEKTQGAHEKNLSEKVPDFIVAAIDARMSEIYWACFRPQMDGLVNLVGEEHMNAPAKIMFERENNESVVLGVGSGWRYKDEMPASLQFINHYPDALPSAIHIARLARRDFANGVATTAEDALPVYLRDNVAWQNG